MTVSISVTLDDELGDELNAATAGGNRSAMVATLSRTACGQRDVGVVRVQPHLVRLGVAVTS